MNKDQIKGRVEEAKGNVKEVTGKLLDNDDMELEGNLQTLVKSKRALAILRMILIKQIKRAELRSPFQTNSSSRHS